MQRCNSHDVGLFKVGGIRFEGDGHPGAGVHFFPRDVQVALPGGAVGDKMTSSNLSASGEVCLYYRSGDQELT